MGTRGHEPRQPLDREGRGGGGDDEVAEPAALEHLHFGEHDDLGEHLPHRRNLPPRERQPGPVRDVDQQHAVGREQRRGLAIELHRGQVRRRLGARVDVADQEVDGAVQTRWKPAEARAGVTDADTDRGAAGERDVLAHEVPQRRFQLEDLLP